MSLWQMAQAAILTRQLARLRRVEPDLSIVSGAPNSRQTAAFIVPSPPGRPSRPILAGAAAAALVPAPVAADKRGRGQGGGEASP